MSKAPAKVLEKSTRGHEVYAKKFEKTIKARTHRKGYATALLIVLGVLFGLGWLIFQG